jgi:hypothetical protein
MQIFDNSEMVTLFCEGSWKIADPGYAKLVSKEHASHDGKGYRFELDVVALFESR